MDEELFQNVAMDEKLVRNIVMNAKVDPKVGDGSVHIQNWWMEQIAAKQPTIIDRINGWEKAVVVDKNSKQRSIPCDTLLGTTLCEFRSTHEEFDVTSWRASCDDTMQRATAFCWWREHLGGHASWREPPMSKVTKNRHVLCARTCVQMEY